MKPVVLSVLVALVGCAGTVDPGRLPCQDDSQCGTGQYCSAPAGKCALAPACSAATTLCHDACVDLQTSLGNCGTCGHVCGAPANGVASACRSAVCEFTCTLPAVQSGGACKPPPAAPTGLRAQAGASVALTWNAATDAVSWIVQRGASAAGPFQDFPATVNSYTDTGVTSGTTYFYVVVGVNVVGAGAASAVVSALTLPGAVTGLVGVGGSGQIRLSWNAVAGAAGYTILHGPPGSTLTVAGPSAITSFTETPIGAGTTVQYQVQAVNATGPGPASPPLSSITLPAAPGNATATGGQNQIHVVWDAVASATSYSIFHAGNATATASGALLTSFTESGIASGTTVQYEVRASNASGAGPASSAGAVTLPDAPALTASATGTVVTLSWTRPPGATSYDVYRGPSAVGETILAPPVSDPGSGAAAGSSDSATAEGTTYFYRVAPRNASGPGAASNHASATTVPAAPTGLQATAVAATSVALKWSRSPGAASYTVLRGATPATETPLAAGPVGDPGAGSTVSFTDATAQVSSGYFYAVTASNGAGTSVRSTPDLSVSTLPPAPANVAATATDESHLTLAWDRPAGGVDSFDVFRGTTSSAEGAVAVATVANPVSGSRVTYSDPGLVSDTLYFYVVVARNGALRSAASAEVSARVLLFPPSGLAVLAPAPTESTVTLAWTQPPAGINNYVYEIWRGTAAGQEVKAGETGGYSTAAATSTDQGLPPSTQFFYKVRSINTTFPASNWSTFTAEASATTTASNGPTFTLGAVDDAHVKFTINRVTGLDAYDFFRCQTGCPTGPLPGSTTSTAGVGPALQGLSSQIFFTDTTPTSTSAWTYSVRGRWTGGGSPTPWAPLQTTTPFSFPPAVPAAPFVPAAGNNVALVQWAQPAAGAGFGLATSYNLERATTSTGPFSPVTCASKANAFCSDPGVSNSLTYFYHVQACNPRGCSSFSGASGTGALIDPNSFVATSSRLSYSDGLDTSEPQNPCLSAASLQIYLLQGATSTGPLSGKGLADGYCVVNGVPATGPVYLKLGGSTVYTPYRTFDRGSESPGRADGLALSVQALTPVTFNLTNLSTWSASDQLGFASGNNAALVAPFLNGTDLVQAATAGVPAPGAAQLSGFTVDASSFTASNGGSEPDTAKGDKPLIAQLSRAVTSNGTNYQFVSRHFPIPVMTLVDGRVTTVSGAFATPVTTSTPFTYLRSQYKALASKVNPAAVPGTGDIFFAWANVMGGDTIKHNPFSGPDLFNITFDSGTADVAAGNLTYTSPYPSTYTAVGELASSFTVTYNVPSQPAPVQLSAGMATIEALGNVLAEAAGTGLAPRITPVLNPRLQWVDSLGVTQNNDAFQDQTGVGTSPTLSWSPPAVGVPTYYRLFVNGLSNGSFAQLFTTGTSITFLPGMLVPGQWYAVTVRAQFEQGRDVLGVTTPFGRRTIHYAMAEMLTNKFTP